ncbi:MAG: META domain-containing protein [Tannerellaceae bacterium]|jgi:heat shock protein HslJ|nr:META domain-containing protein [Tannerellaceae bacterium]
MRKIFYLYACLVTLALAGCKNRQMTVSFSGLNGEWDVVELNGNKLPAEETKPRLSFDAAGRNLSANAGCNHIAGEVETSTDGSVRFLQLVSTRKACLHATRENQLLKALNEVVRFEASNETTKTLVFYDANRQRLFAIEKAVR